MKKKNIKVTNLTGLHARPASQLTKLATIFKSNIEIEFKNKKYNVKSIISILSAGISQGSEIVLVTNGVDEVEAIQKISHFLDNELVD